MSGIVILYLYFVIKYGIVFILRHTPDMTMIQINPRLPEPLFVTKCLWGVVTTPVIVISTTKCGVIYYHSIGKGLLFPIYTRIITIGQGVT